MAKEYEKPGEPSFTRKKICERIAAARGGTLQVYKIGQIQGIAGDGRS
jgi:hypothetical protein